MKTTGFEDIIGRLKAYEERIKNEDINAETQGELLYANTHQQCFSTSQGKKDMAEVDVDIEVKVEEGLIHKIGQSKPIIPKRRRIYRI